MFFIKYIISLTEMDTYLLSINDISVWKSDTPLVDYDPNVRDANTFTQGEVSVLLENPFKIREHNGVHFSIMDLRSLRIRTDKSIKEFVSKNFGIDLDRKDGMLIFNRLYQESIALYEERYLRQVPKTLKEIKFTSIKDIRDFLWTTWEWLLGTYKCDLVKVFFSCAKSKNNIQYRDIKKIHQIVAERVFRGLALLPLNPINITWSKTINTKFDWLFWEWTEFSWFDRYKSLASIVWKEIWNIKYNSLEDFKDLHWFTFRLKSKDDVLRFIDYLLRYNIIDKIDDLDVLFMFCKEEIQNSKLISEHTRSYILRFIEDDDPNKKRKEKWTSKRYSACSVKWKMKFKDPHDEGAVEEFTWVEFKIELQNNENEYGTSFHGILDIMKVFRELTRLSWVIRFKDVINQVNHFFKTLESELKEKWKVLWEYLNELYNDLVEQKFQSPVINWDELPFERKVELLERSLLRYVIDDLVPVKLNRRKRNVYFVHRNYLKQSIAGIQPDLEEVEIKTSQ